MRQCSFSLHSHPAVALQLNTAIPVAALFLVFIDYLISSGPLRPLVIRFFPLDPAKDGRREARKICGQVAARVVGCIFLYAMVRSLQQTARGWHTPVYAVCVIFFTHIKEVQTAPLHDAP